MTKTPILKGKKALVIDDDIVLSNVISFVLSEMGAVVETAENGKEGLQKLYSLKPDLVILDILMPEMDGWETCRQIRLLSDVPIIMLTTIADDASVIRGLDYGADDFLAKPFSQDVLAARIRAVMRRSAQYKNTPADNRRYEDGYLLIDLSLRRVEVAGEPVKLTATEYNLLSYLVQNAGLVLTHDQILENVWGSEYKGSADYVHVYVSHLRQKLEPDPKEPVYLVTEFGVGYRFVKQSSAMAHS
ncbi:MAG: response regulator transcription factor [Candidatus Promineifilaceae bacterium]